MTTGGKDPSYSLIVVGTSFASSFFLWRYLRKAGPGERILVLERGGRIEHRELIKRPFMEIFDEGNRYFLNRNPEKSWVFRVLFGGCSNCWTGNTPRQLPEDFELRSRYGVGVDWPLTYDELEPYYCDVEDAMPVAGPSDDSPFPRSRPYPLPPHRQNDPDLLLKKAYPEDFFVLPAARPSLDTQRRPRCCANNICPLCPINSKFTVMNSEVGDAYRDPRVELVLGARVDAVDTQAGRATGVVYTREGREERTKGEVVALGANAIMNPHILIRSGLEHPWLGRGICEQIGAAFDVYLGGLDSFQGSTIQTGHGYMLHRGRRRRERAAALLETANMVFLRMERGKWRQRMMVKLVFEDLPRRDNLVRPSDEDPTRPEVVYNGHSDYAQRGIDALSAEVEKVLSPLPVEKIFPMAAPPTEAHIQCSVRMGRDPAESVVDRHLVHHRIRNLLVLGASAFPTCPPANPTLTLSALSLWAADHLKARS